MSRTESGSFKPVEEAQRQDLPGLEKDMKPTSESTALEGKHQHQEYLAAGKLKGNKALITGGDSGIGRSVAVLFAREGSDVTIVYLPEEEEDARETKKMVEKEGKECLLIPGNLMDNETCRKAVEQHMQRGTAAMVDYASTKGAITSFTQSLAKQLMPKGIRVNAVAPGPVHTPLQPASRPAEQMEGFGAKSGIGRPGQPSEIAPSFIFLASKDAELYYGQVLHAYPLGD
ncbi:uncharacterized oxidoreductase YhdF [Trichoderma asperellum]|uniref:Uncharacterized oxidoreductase YhdF n=1 Tax=Trichoderma asperellum TaxID=101201 RepID=A0A6V8QSU1_TRIAP|nr:uncharacterized oxidoreductase YhdF [Trichoderma asperellum]